MKFEHQVIVMTKKFNELFEVYKGFREEIFRRCILLPIKVGPSTFRDATISSERRKTLDELKKLLPEEVKKTKGIDKLYELYVLSFRFQEYNLRDRVLNKMRVRIAKLKKPSRKMLGRLNRYESNLRMIYSDHRLFIPKKLCELYKKS